MNLSDFNLSGCKIVILFNKATSLTAHAFSCFPRPVLLSGGVIVATISNPQLIKYSRFLAAKFGVPKNMIFILQIYLFH